MNKDNKVEDWDENYSETQPDAVDDHSEGNDGGENTNEVEVDDLSVEEGLREDLVKEKDKFLRLFAEFENYKKRTSKERMDLFKTAGQDVIVSLLPILDDFDRAMKELAQSEDDAHFKGVELIKIKFQEILKSKGLLEINVKQGDPFDAEVHDAITQIPAPEKKLKGKIVDVIEKGFRLGDKIIRHPKVVVGN
ncbi:nucleotide exchange factor GrpE [Flavobacteriaceae bacterium F89]|jgi:molecular chaperone GrpE|uniref:Protein GrpE n=1 Tax=Cerina litoralis TaxID=2874477 RepID=A0AAE3EUI8_9FLAO|nr:nucleotide exchange factor GrpE [Cerina litoralis]MCG2460623.1 nucleotide exchange factor GrpE [Cerina litoralis]